MAEQKSENTSLVNIVMATYNPRMDWFEEQLKSLNNQTYKNIKMTILDDCSNTISFEEIKAYVQKHITKFPFTIQQNENNLGSNKTFEKLTKMAEGEYIAYCDQDDIWLPEKVEKLVDFIQQTKSTLVCSDVYVIDETDIIKANSITEIRKRHTFKDGENLASDLLFKNFVIGCTMLLPTAIARAAIPFIEEMVHDHYLALYASTKGSIGVYKENLIRYRIHESNQTNVMVGVKTKKDYYEVRIKPYLRRMEQIVGRFDIPKAKEAYEWAVAREGSYHKKNGCSKTLWQLRKLNKITTIFELVMFKMPLPIFKLAVTLIQRGMI